MENPEKKANKGCLFYGCLATMILALIAVAVIVYLGFKLRDIALEFTDTEPLELATSSVSPEMAAQAEEKVKAFMTAVAAGEDISRMTLSDEEVNALIATHEQLSEFRGMVEVDFSDNRVSGRVSLPLAEFGMPGRYLNGSATFNLECRDGLLLVTLDSLEVKGRNVPDTIMNEIRKQNMAENLYKDVESIEQVKRLKRVEVQGNRLVLEVLPEQPREHLETDAEL